MRENRVADQGFRTERRPLGAIGALAAAVRPKQPNLPAPKAADPRQEPQRHAQTPSEDWDETPSATLPPRPDFLKTLKTILTPGTEGPEVTSVQEKLITLKLLKGPATGKYDAATEAAVRKFQQSIKIEVNGRVGPYTLQKINDAVAVYGPGSVGPGVLTVQNHLRKLGYLKADATGLYDAATEKAVLAFQKDYRIEQTGKVGPTTREFIAEAMVEATQIDTKYAAHQELLARAIAAEARGEPFEAKVGVAATILNYARMHDRKLPKLVRSGYLSSNYDGNRRFYTMPVSKISNWDECYRAAGEALAGRSRIGNRSHFIDDSIGPPVWVDPKSALKIGRMIFYRSRTS